MKKKCVICEKDFSIFRWRYTCQICNSEVCADCFEKNEKKCSNCLSQKCDGCKKIFKNKYLVNKNVYKLCQECNSNFEINKNSWISGTKQEYLRGYKIEKELEFVEINVKCDSPNKVEELLITKCLILGANSYIKFFWKRHVNSTPETDVNFSMKGNVYYTTKYNKMEYFTGSALAVIVKSLNK